MPRQLEQLHRRGHVEAIDRPLQFREAALPCLRILTLLSGLLATMRGTAGLTRAVLFKAFAAALSRPARRP
jgi:hypothetical protein